MQTVEPPSAAAERGVECAPKPPRRITPAALAYLIAQLALFDVFLYQGSGGLGLGVLLGASAVLLLAFSRPRATRALGGFALLVLAVAARAAWQSSAATLFVGLGALFALRSCAVGNPTRIAALARSAFASARSSPGVLGGAVRVTVRLSGRFFAGRETLIATLVPVSVVFVFLVLFALANTVLAAWLGDALAALGNRFSRAYELLYAPERFVAWTAFALLAATLAFPKRTAANPALEPPRVGPPPEPRPASALATRTARNTLVGVNVLFLAYNAVDVVYLWIQHALPAGTSYSDYAREGVFWLAAALALTSVVLGVMFSGALSRGEAALKLKALAALWLGQNLFLAFLACQRLYIYFSFNGLTEMRILGALGIAAVVSGLGVVALKLHRGHDLAWLVGQQVNLLTGFSLVFFLLPTGALVSHVNASRVLNARTLDEIAPAVILSHHRPTPESLPGLIPLLYMDNEALPDEVNLAVRQGVAGILAQADDRLRARRGRETRWTYREWATLRALRAIDANRPRVDALLAGRNPQRAKQDLKQLTRQWW